MIVEIRKSFKKDTEKLPSSAKIQLENVIEKIITAKKLSELSACKKLTGYKSAYRLRIAHYRIGFFFENEIVELVRILDRKEIYKYFP